jgi:AraC-like DNA-binding protein
MLKNLLRKKNSVIYTWLISYLTFLILFTIISILTYVNTKKVIYDEVHRSNTLLLTRVRNGMDNILRESKSLTAQVMFNPRIQQIITLRGKLTDPEYFEITKAVNDLRYYTGSNNSVDDLYIFLKDIDTVITPSYSMDIKTFFKIKFNDNEESYIAWLQLLSEKTVDKYFVSSNNQINYIRSLSVTDSKNLNTSIIVAIDKERFLQEVAGIDSINKGTTFILDGQNNILASSGQLSKPTKLTYENLTDVSGTIYLNVSGKKLVASYISSQINDWKYITILPEEIFMARVNHTKNVAYGGIIFSIFLAGLLIYFFLKKNYNPVSKLLNLLNNEMLQSPAEEGNEYSIIEKTINKTLNDKKEIANQLNNQKQLLKDNFLEKLLKGHAQEILPVQEALDSYNINFDSNKFAAMLIFIDEYDKGLKHLSTGGVTTFNGVNFIISNILEEVLSTYHKAITIEVDGNLVCLINLETDRIAYDKGLLLKEAQEAQQFIWGHFHIKISLSLSTIHENIENINKAYNEALDTMNYKKILGIEKILFYDDLEDLSQANYYYPLGLEQQLTNCIKAGDYSNAKTIMDEIFEKNFEKKYLTAHLAQCLMLNLVSTMIRTVNEVSNISEGNFLSDLNPMQKLLPCKTVEEMRHQLDIFLKDFCQHMNEINSSSSNWIINDVIPYILNNYADENLSLSVIAEQFDVSPVYMSRAFKEHVGEGLLDYISKTRIKKSKILLIEKEEINLTEIAVEVGFSNVRSFSRAFKKYEGITPGKFREIEGNINITKNLLDSE